ncbi:hypothetical protein [Leptospira weilii]|uniref:Uncharacterized protein n=1 Tax=Leptospira weilii str. UI 13098 TaxID=1088542 RepID=M6Q5K2_9LEPT|nr:hypothetical protein [Leptospira weilii]EMN90544.1 hypothetical protein LEP1GSC108_2806 [Leptospira weilii str. UI 13098]
MRRTRTIKTKKQDGSQGVTYQDFYNKTLVSTANLKGGSIKLFQSSNTLVLNHAKNDSPMPTKKGSVIVMHAQILAPDYGILQFDSTNLGILNDLEIFRNTFELDFKIGNETIHEDALSTLIEPMPMIFKTTDQGTVNNVIRPAFQAIPRKAESVWMKRSGQLIIPFDRPIPVKNEVFSLELRPMENAVNPTTQIESYKIQFRIGASNDLANNKIANR